MFLEQPLFNEMIPTKKTKYLMTMTLNLYSNFLGYLACLSIRVMLCVPLNLSPIFPTLNLIDSFNWLPRSCLHGNYFWANQTQGGQSGENFGGAQRVSSSINGKIYICCSYTICGRIRCGWWGKF